MNSLERIMTAITGNEHDYQPFTILMSLYGASLIKANTLEYYRNPELWFKGQMAGVELFDPDIMLTPFSFPIEAEAFGSELVFFENAEPNIKKPIITDLSRIDKLILPDLEKSEPMQFFLQSTNLLVKNFKGTKAIASPLQSPADIPNLLMGIEQWIDALLFHPNEVDKIMEKTCEHFVNLGNEFLSRGSDFLIVPVNFTNPMIITEKIFSKLIPYIEKAFNQIKGPIVIHNGGCKIMSFIDRFAKLPNVIALVLEPSESFDMAREIVGEKIVLMGNLDGPALVHMSKEKVKEKTMNILNNRRLDNHFIFATSNADIPYHTPIENIKTMVETIKNFKKL